jgi:deoxyhypusine synthase
VPVSIGGGPTISAANLIDRTFLAYNGGRLRGAAKLLAEKMLPRDGYIGLGLIEALMRAGLGKSCLVPQIKAGSALLPRWKSGGPPAAHSA